jgi:hypothetical protein
VDKSTPRHTSNSTCPKPVGKALLGQTPKGFSTGWHCPQAQDEEYLRFLRSFFDNKKVFKFVGISSKMVP